MPSQTVYVTHEPVCVGLDATRTEHDTSSSRQQRDGHLRLEIQIILY